jgi:hypothetical protein
MLKPEYQSTLKDIIAEEKAALPAKTLKYWKLTRCWNGLDTDKTMTVSKALDTIRNIQSELNPQRPLNAGLSSLRDQIVEHGSKAKAPKPTQTQVKIVIL